jgi:hypothetical protein
MLYLKILNVKIIAKVQIEDVLIIVLNQVDLKKYVEVFVVIGMKVVFINVFIITIVLNSYTKINNKYNIKKIIIDS